MKQFKDAAVHATYLRLCHVIEALEYSIEDLQKERETVQQRITEKMEEICKPKVKGRAGLIRELEFQRVIMADLDGMYDGQRAASQFYSDELEALIDANEYDDVPPPSVQRRRRSKHQSNQ